MLWRSREGNMAFGQTQAPTAGTAQATPQSALLSFMPLILIFVIFYFLLIMPQQKKQKKQQAMIEALKPGDEVVTLGGLFGKIVEVKAETFVIEIANNTRVKISRAAVSHKV